MTAPRTVTVQTSDHGPVNIPCPHWCTGAYHQEGGARVDITHTGPENELTVPTSSGPTRLMATVLEQRPFTEGATGRGVFIDVEIDGEYHPTGPHGLDAMADALVENASILRAEARRLTTLLAQEGK
ncbi:DUF6907 domain-containing protein [Streptomyces enissocaesilis]|uniref:Uncharacterized protein n=1 Tax=Streptomyces enissocaesilis TaxID=332589 RepID=A0ABP6K8H4_9ACTN